MGIMSSFVNERIAGEESILARYNERSSITSRESQTACASCCPESWPSTPCLRARRPSPSPPAPMENDISLVMALEPSDLSGSAYIVKITGESKNYFLEFENTNSTAPPPPLVFNASYHGLYYIITLMVMTDNMMTKPAQSITVLTKPLPVTSVSIHDYKPSPEKGVIFEIKYPEKFNVFTRVNISYLEDKEPRSMLYKDFFRGKTVFKHWLPGTCYSNITFQLVSEATVNRSTLVRFSGVGHEPKQHRTVPNPPTNISHQIVYITAGTFSGRAEAGSGQGEEEANTLQPYDLTEHMNESYSWEPGTYTVSITTVSSSGVCDTRESTSDTSFTLYLNYNYNGSDTQPSPTQPSWPSAVPPTLGDSEEFVNRPVEDYEDENELGSAVESPPAATPFPALLLQLQWVPPLPPTAYDGFNIYIYRDGPEGEWFEALQERPQDVSVMLLSSTSASLSWSPSQETHSGSLVSLLSLTCHKPKPSQRMESHYCTQVNSSSSSIGNLTPGAQYRVVVYHTNGPLVGPPSEPVIFGIEPTGVRDLVLYPLEPTALILSWSRPYHVTFRKYVVEMFYFNPATLTPEWSTYYEIAGTVSLTASVRVTNLLPAWYYNFRVTMVTWGEPELSCCDSSTVSFITAPEAPEISSVEYSNRLLNVGWKYSEGYTDLAHSRMLHWLVVAEGRKRVKKSISSDVSRSVMRAVLSLPPGDIYNLTVTACTERSKNTSQPRIIQLEPAPPKSLFAVNKSQTSVTLLWVEEGVVDFYRVFCKQVESDGELKQEQLSVNNHMVTIDSLLPSTAYNCSVTSFSHSTPSEPAYIRVSTLVPEMNPNVLVISALAVLSILLLGLLLLLLLVLRKKHLQMGRECGAGTFVNFASLERGGKLPYNCPVQLDDFDTYMKDMSRDSGYKFSLQFEDLKHVGLDLPHEAADLPVNRAKNRYTNILPYDFSRVKLISMHNDEGSDYINANYIPGYRSPQEYIATQGPLPETRNDFWKMVLQEKCCMVVMLTQCSERRRVKCDHYWPFTEEPVVYGDVTVEMTSEKEVTEWAIRNFRLSYADEIQDVLHLNYTSWPDHGVPTVNAAESILQFVQIVRQQAARRKGPVLVHCSAGVGRTGTFIALDRLLQHIREHEYVDILGLVSEMRSHRLSMVQTEEQYVFIHQCVQLMWWKRKQIHSAGEIIYENTSKS
ncbi:Receptor-type tyrosine-protein phosphatase O [Acipenser ruthenus]|uniref:Receptor-type tyrosine-protein phosphatase O n=1 Tax=Acipenser ruthenus TaxID=7906 RepID=A0A444UIG9_ACIRT|nr:Receptor-type tyrosine-protein phosphatase O [Acipenser ruthenus]